MDLNHLLDQILKHPDIVKQPNSAGEATAWCPWHSDRQGGNPSLGINVRKQVVKCWVCNKGGVVQLAKAWGIPVPDDKEQSAAPITTTAEAVDKLKQAYMLRDETLAHYKIVASLDSYSPDRSKQGAWRYPTGAGTRYKAFQRGAPYKYWWSRGTRREKRAKYLYGLADVPQETDTAYLVNGEPSVWVCYQAGVPAVCSFGEGNLSGDQVQALADAGIKTVRLVLDLDDGGAYSTARDVELMRDRGLQPITCQLPEYLGPKADAADLYLWHSGDDKAFAAAMASLPTRSLPQADPLRDTRYSIRQGKIYVTQQTRDGELEIPITNFTAHASAEVLIDDGTEAVLNQVFEGELDTGEKLPQVHVPAAKSQTLGWIGEQWGFKAIIRAGASSRDSVREVIQRVSLANGLPRRTIYSHTGWRQIDGEWRYLMPTGAVGENGVQVELDQAYRRYSLPRRPVDQVEAVKASLRFLDISEHRLTLPMLAFCYLAPLQSILRPAFTLWLRASTGSYKSTATALLMNHFGNFAYNTPPLTWESTARGIERYLFDLKDCLAWIDDFNPKQTDRETAKQYEKAETVLRSLGNVQGRTRMRADTRLQTTYTPRSLLISTGEMYPMGQSLLARIFPIDFAKGDVSLGDLSMAQAEADLYGHAMVAYCLWLSKHYSEYEKQLPERFNELRAELASMKGHARIPAAVASLTIATDVLADFIVDIGARSEAEAWELRAEARGTFSSLGSEHSTRIYEQNSIDQFIDVLDTLLSQNKAVFMAKGTDEHPPFGQDLMGWYDNDYIYLDPTAAYNRVARWMRDEGRALGINTQGLRQGLVEYGYAEASEAGHFTTRIRTNGRIHRILKLEREKVPFSEALPKTIF